MISFKEVKLAEKYLWDRTVSMYLFDKPHKYSTRKSGPELDSDFCKFTNGSELQISCVFALFALKKRTKTHVLSDQSVHITHTYCCVSKLSKFGAYLYAVNDNTVVYINNTFYVFEKFPVITSLYTFRRRERIHPRGTECLPF